MHDLSFFGQLLAVMAIAVVVVFLSHKVRLPSVVGFLVAGVLVGPVGFGIVGYSADIELMAEIGVALLLFTVGIEVSLRDMVRLARTVFGGGGAQVTVTIAAAAGGLLLLDVPPRVALLLGCLVALSSTAIVLKLLADRGDTDSVQGRTMLGVLIFQDLAFVPILLLIPVLAGAAADVWAVLLVLAKAAGVIGGLALVARFVFPWLLARVVAARNRELFTLTTLVVALGTAWLTAVAGLSLALGAFLAGMVLSESEYGHQALADVTPVRDAFNSLFFVSIGMLLDPGVILGAPLLVAGLTAAVVLLKATVAGAVSLALSQSLRVALLVGLGLSQVGEFSFVLAQVAVGAGLLEAAHHQLFLAVSILTMTLTPALIGLSHRLARGEERLVALGQRLRLGRGSPPPVEDGSAGLRDHVIIVGYGLNGRRVARVLRQLGVPHVITELNARTVREAREEGEPAVYGDATRALVLEHVGVAQARAVVVTLPDIGAARQIVAHARRLGPGAVVIARTRFDAEVDRLHALGAHMVVPEEFETSLALAGAVMATYGASAHAIDRERKAIRDERYALLRQRGHEPLEDRGPTLTQLLSALDVRILRLAPSAAPAGGAALTLRELDVRARTGASIIAVGRGGQFQANPEPGATLAAGAHVVLLGSREQLDAAQARLEAALDVTAIEGPLPPSAARP
jgi:CPA2 family monovalent cation:H+ antiporter-2